MKSILLCIDLSEIGLDALCSAYSRTHNKDLTMRGFEELVIFSCGATARGLPLGQRLSKSYERWFCSYLTVVGPSEGKADHHLSGVNPKPSALRFVTLFLKSVYTIVILL